MRFYKDFWIFNFLNVRIHYVEMCRDLSMKIDMRVTTNKQIICAKGERQITSQLL